MCLNIMLAYIFNYLGIHNLQLNQYRPILCSLLHFYRFTHHTHILHACIKTGFEKFSSVCDLDP